MKKLLAIILAVITMFLLPACGNNDNVSEKEEHQPEKQITIVQPITDGGDFAGGNYK